MFRSSRVYLRALELDDYKLLNKWHNDEEVQSLIGGNKHYVSSEYDKKWVEDKIFDNRNQIYWAICSKKNDKLMGYIAVKDIDWVNRNVLYHAIVIGDKADRNIQNSLDSINLMLDYVFNQLGLHRIYGYHLKEHKSSIMLSKMVGFKVEGTMKEALYKDGTFHDLLIISLLKDDFAKTREKKAKKSGKKLMSKS